LHKHKVVDIYNKFLNQIEVCIIDIAAELVKLGDTRFKLISTTFDINSTINEYTSVTAKYISDMISNVETLKSSSNLVQTDTSLNEIKSYLDSYAGFVLVLIDVEKIPSNGREITGTY
jgi:hypothetical protein